MDMIIIWLERTVALWLVVLLPLTLLVRHVIRHGDTPLLDVMRLSGGRAARRRTSTESDTERRSTPDNP
jgi:hypothetical protein